MYKELYKQEINILGMSNSIYLVSMNENMKTILNRYKMEYQPLLTTTIPRRLYNYIETGVEFRKDVNSYTYKSVKKFELYYEDKTGNEYSNNKIYVDKYPNTAYTLRISLNFAFALAKLLEEFPDKFNIVLRYDFSQSCNYNQKYFESNCGFTSVFCHSCDFVVKTKIASS